MISVAQALQQILSNVSQTCAETVALSEAHNRALAQDVVANLTQPNLAVSSMDGYAVKSSDLNAIPTPLTVIGESPAGGCFTGNVGKGEAVRIFTGAPVPVDTDTIIIQENTTRDGDLIQVLEPAKAGCFIRPKGLDFSVGDVLIKAPKVLTARDLGLAAAANVPWLAVKRRPIIAIIATGNEVVMPGEPLGENQIISSNSVLLKAYVESLGAKALNLGIAQDDKKSLARLLASANQADLLITIGGASVGDYDLVNQVLDEQGVDLGFYRVAMRPGKPLIFGKLNGTPVLGLPGNPVSVGVTSAVFLKPAILTMLGLDSHITPVSATLDVNVNENDQRQDYLRATTTYDERGQAIVTPFNKQDSAMLSRFAKADCLIIRPPHAPAANAGDNVEIIKLC